MLVVIALSLLFGTFTDDFDNYDAGYDYDDIIITTYPEGYIPETMSEWLSRQPDTEPFDVCTVYKTPFTGKSTTFLVVLEDGLHSAIGITLLQQWAEDIESQNHIVEIVEVTYSTPEELRSYFFDKYQDGLEGAVLVGDINVAWSGLGSDQLDYFDSFPSDFFFMDLNGDWEDLWIGDPSSGVSGQDDIYDTWSGDLYPEIYVGRILTSNLNGDEITLITDYLERNHTWRMEGDPTPLQALCYVDDDWAGGAAFNWQRPMLYLYPETELINDVNQTCADDYEDNRLTADYVWISPFVHSSPLLHQWHPAPFTYTNLTELLTIEPNAHFYNLFACSNSRFTENNMGGTYSLVNPNGLAAVGSTKSGAMLFFDFFYKPLGEGASLGEAYQDWWDFIIWGGFSASEKGWHLGMVILGDPTLIPAMFTLSIPTTGEETVASINFRPESNPCRCTVVFIAEGISGATLRIRDITGRLVFEDISFDCSESVDLTGFQPGIYFAELIAGEQPIAVSRFTVLD